MFEVVAKAGDDHVCKTKDPHEREKYLALRILRLAGQCQVSSFVFLFCCPGDYLIK